MEGLYSADYFFDQVRKSFEDENTLSPLRDAVKHAKDWRARLQAIRALYQAHIDLGADFSAFDPYCLELHDYWTPIEWRLWQDVRSLGRLRFVPQFPVGPYFLDFADPTRKIAIEADGKQFHDAARDRKRDQDLFDRYEWRVFRVTGAETFRVRPSPWEVERALWERDGIYPDREDVRRAAREFFLTTSEGVVRALRDVEFDGQRGEWFDEMAETLDMHRLASFPVGCC